MQKVLRARYKSPIGILSITATERGIRSVDFTDDKVPVDKNVSQAMQACIKQLDAYFSDKQKSFHSLPLALSGTEFQLKVWEAAMNIPYGQKITYSQLAEEIAYPRAARAVGNALNRNPLIVIVPCHRIVPASGTSGNYRGGAWRKQWLLKHESQ